MTKLLIFSTIVANFLCTFAHATEVFIESDVADGATTSETVFDVKGTKTVERKSRLTTTFTLALPDTSASEVLSVTLITGTAGFASYSQKFDIPFHDNKVDYFPSVVKEAGSDQDARNFVSQASANQVGQDLFNFNQRARVLFHKRSGPGPEPISEDVTVAYWLVQSTGALVSRARMVVDSDTRAAAAKLGEWTTSNDRLSKAFFAANPGISSENVAFWLKTINDRDRTVRAPLITALDSAMLRVATRTDSCRRVKSLRDVFDDERNDGVASYEGWRWQHILVVGISLKCDYAQVSTLRSQAQQVPSNVLEDVSFDLQDLDGLVVAYQASSERNSERDREVRKRIQAATDLARFVGSDLPGGLTAFK